MPPGAYRPSPLRSAPRPARAAALAGRPGSRTRRTAGSLRASSEALEDRFASGEGNGPPLPHRTNVQEIGGSTTRPGDTDGAPRSGVGPLNAASGGSPGPFAGRAVPGEALPVDPSAGPSSARGLRRAQEAPGAASRPGARLGLSGSFDVTPAVTGAFVERPRVTALRGVPHNTLIFQSPPDRGRRGALPEVMRRRGQAGHRGGPWRRSLPRRPPARRPVPRRPALRP